MKVDSNKPCRIVYSLLQHQYLGYIFEPHIVQMHGEATYTLLYRRLFSQTAPDYAAYLDAADLEIIALLDQVEQENMVRRIYPKVIRSRDFFANKWNDAYKAKALPVIDSVMGKALALMYKHHKTLFIMGKEGYPAWQPIAFAEEAASVLFHFRRSEETTRYFPTIKYKEERMEFMFRDAQVVSNYPGWLLLDEILYFFNGDVDGKKLAPFLEKRYIEIPRASEPTYYRKFVTPLIEKHSVYAQGFDIITEKYEASPALRINLNAERPCIELMFTYADYQFPFGTEMKASVSMEEKNDSYVFHRVRRSRSWEEKKAAALHDLGLSFEPPNQFILPSAIDTEDGFLLHDWINEHFDRLTEMDFTIEPPEGKKNYLFARSFIDLKFSENNDWFDVHAIVHFGAYQVPFMDLKQHILNRIREFVLPNGLIAIIPEVWFNTYGNLYSFMEGTKNLKLRKYHIGLIQMYSSSHLAEVTMDRKLEKLQDFEGIEEQTVPEHFMGTLRPYQQAGFNWFLFLKQFRLGGCLADDMGLGKTVQTLALLQYLKEQNGDEQTTSLLVVPTSLIDNWTKEAKKFTPELKVHVFRGSDREKDVSTFSQYDLILSTYGVVRVDHELLQKFFFSYIILDESQNIKNWQSKSYKALKTLKAQNRLILTGTPIENSLGDLWSQLSFINPGLLGSHTFFTNEFIIPIEKKQDEAKLERLQAIIKPFILRRTKDQVATELPAKTEQVFYCGMTEKQEEVYEETKSYYRNELLNLVTEQGEGRSRVSVLQGLTKLRQLANHPRMIDPAYEHDSWKFSLVLELLQNVVRKGHKVLVFSQFVKHLVLIRQELEKLNIRYAYLDGATQNREANINAFKENEDVQLFLISIKAGGTGLNLTEADYVFLLDPWWNPAVEQQAVDRAHRIGQTKTVFIYKFITKNTVEEKILQLQKRKKALSGSLITTENTFEKSLTAEDIKALLD